MNRSTNLNLYLPESSDYRDVSQLTYNFSTIDTEIMNLHGYCGQLSSSNDANSLTKNGFYYIGSTVPLNVPSDFVWSYLIQLTPTESASMKHQYLIKPSNNRIMIREYSGNPSSWLSWMDAQRAGGISWGTSFSIVCDRNVCDVSVNHDLRIQVYLGASSDITVGVTAITESGISGFTKSSSNGSVSFSGYDASGTNFTVSRNGKTVTITKNNSSAAMVAHA